MNLTRGRPPLNRRSWLSAAGGCGYSLCVSAALPASNAPPDADHGVGPATHSAGAEPHLRLTELTTDFCVAGAALAAARHGVRVILMCDRSRLGGNSSSEVKMHVVGANCHKGRSGWREGGLIDKLRLDDAARNPLRCWELWDLLLYDKLVSEPNITVLLDTTLYAATVDAGRIVSVLAPCDRNEVSYRISATMFADCTGDSRLGLEAGAEFRTGREAQVEYRESLAPERADQQTLGSSILFTSRDYDRPVRFTPPVWARKINREQLRFRPTGSWEYGYWWIEWGGERDLIHDGERIRFELLAIVMGVWDYIKNSGDHPSSANWSLDWLGMLPGKRSSRRLLGDYVLTQQDLLSGVAFADAVAIGGWPLDNHPPGGFDRPDLPPNTVVKPERVYGIPLRTLYSRNVSNLWMAGSNISATHAAFTSTRVMATCACVGQAAGTAAAFCVKSKLTPRALAADSTRVLELRRSLLRDDQTIAAARNDDPLDLARGARMSVSTEEAEGAASKLLDGHVRDIPGEASHKWMGRLNADGAWIELVWPEPVTLHEIRLTFDSGFQRELTLTSSTEINSGILRGPQPETVRDYVLLADGEELVRVTENHQRLRTHRFAGVELRSLRLWVLATNGSELARVFEIRCYS